MALQDLFTTQVYVEQLLSPRAKLHRELLAECHQLRQYDSEGQEWCEENYIGGYTSYSSLCSLHRMSSTFRELESLIDKEVLRFSRALDFDLCGGKLSMVDCWINMMPAQVSHGLHLHPLGCISGTYYVAAPTNAPGIKFEDPRLDRFMAAPPRKSRPRQKNRAHVSLEPKPGRVILFESWLRHEVPAGVHSGERISVSFNYHWER